MGKIELLIVDDSPTIRKKIRSIAEKSVEADIYEAEDAWAALRLIGNHFIDIALMDINMPKMSGFEAVRMIRSQKKSAELPIIFITGEDPEKRYEELGLQLGGVDYLTKPFTDMELSHKLKLYVRFVERERRIRETAASAEAPKKTSSPSKEKILALAGEIAEAQNRFENILEYMENMRSAFFRLDDSQNFNMLESVNKSATEFKATFRKLRKNAESLAESAEPDIEL